MLDAIRRGIARRTESMRTAMGENKPPIDKVKLKAIASNKPRGGINDDTAGMQAMNGVTVVDPPRTQMMADRAAYVSRRSGLTRKPWYVR